MGSHLFAILNSKQHKKTIDSYSWAFGPEGVAAYVMGKDFRVPKTGLSLTEEVCVPNNVHQDEGQFLFRLRFAEGKHKTIWESQEYKSIRKELEDRLSNAPPIKIVK
jgi:hypothetical protein